MKVKLRLMNFNIFGFHIPYSSSGVIAKLINRKKYTCLISH